MMTLRDIPADLRCARLRAARRYGIYSVPRRAILRGDWDAGTVVRQFLTEPCPWSHRENQ